MSDDAERIWDLMERSPLCTLTAWNGRELRSRPMSAFVRRRNEALYLLPDASIYDEHSIRLYPVVSLTFADCSPGWIASVTGIAELSADRSVIRELWATAARQSWTSAEDPRIRMLRISPREAHLWDETTTRAVTMMQHRMKP